MTTGGNEPGRGQGRYGGVNVGANQRAIIEQSRREGLTLDQTQTRLQTLGVGLRRQAISQIRNEAIRRVETTPRISVFRRDFRPTSELVTRTNQRFASTYRVRGVVRAFNPATQSIDDILISFGSDELTSLEAFEQRARDIFKRGNDTRASAAYGGERLEFDEFNLDSIEESGF